MPRSLLPTSPSLPHASQAATHTTGRNTFMDVVHSIFEPGTNTGLVRAMSFSFYALFATLLGMVWLTGGNLHVVALLGLSVALFVSIKWFLIQIAEEEEKQRQMRLRTGEDDATVMSKEKKAE
ncbi:hypothetical protein JCM10213_008789 [Rhodosporidiobolus nylandii]